MLRQCHYLKEVVANGSENVPCKKHEGFVCFMNREDAEEAMDACNEADPFKVGRLLMMRWGKNVKKIVKRGHGTGGVKPIL